MGRDNEFKSYTKRETSFASKNYSAYNNDMGAVLRKHNFSFGFDDRRRLVKDMANETAQAAKNLYEGVACGDLERHLAFRQEQKERNRSSHIQWGLKAEGAAWEQEKSQSKAMN